jgi:hypothetical protein
VTQANGEAEIPDQRLGTSRVHSAKLAAILNANTQYAAEGWYINTKAILVSFGETVT